jgi:two-component system phosphate regulon sensor histidine kinase PhoR
MSRQRHISAQLKRVLVLIFIFVVTPSACLLSVGVLLLALGHRASDIVFGVLILSLVAAMVVGTITMLVYLFRTKTLARLQTDFVNKVSHDLRTPLTSIRMFAETLQLGRAADPDATRECLEAIQAETLRLTAMIDRLLEWGKMEAGKRPYQPVTHEVREVVDGAVAALRLLLRERPLVVSVEVPPDLPRVEVDLDAMVEALLNLLQNAAKYAGDDPRITVRCARERRGVAIAVIDQGPGVPASEHRRIFEKFYRGAATGERRQPGSGLGLAIVEHIVRGHDGRVTLESEAGAGATFTIHLPAARA